MIGVAALTITLPLLAPSAAVAAPGPIKQPTAAVVTADAIPTAQINGVVWSQAIVGNTVFAGGEFTSVRPAGAAAGTGEVARSNLMSYDITTGKATTFAPTFNGPVKVLQVSPDKKTLYVGGSFTVVNGVKRDRFAAFTVATGALTALAPDVNNTVNAIAVIGSTVYLGGSFNTFTMSKLNYSRNRLVAVDATNGALKPWAPVADATVQALVASPDSKRVIVAGNFGKLGTTTAPGMGSLDALTGAALPWKINTVVKNYGTDSAITTLTADNDTIYGSGYTYGGPKAQGNFEGVFAADPTTGNVKWLQDCHGDTYDIAPIGDVIYSVGHAHFCSNIGGFPDSTPRLLYRALAATKQATGTVLKNSQSGTNYGNFEGQPAPSLYNWFPDISAGTFTGKTQGAWSITGNSSYVALGGEFPKVNGQPQQGLVVLRLPAAAPNKVGPQDTDFGVQAHTATSVNVPPVAAPNPSGPGVTISWKANWDRDDQLLSYDVLRNGKRIKTLTATSQFWRRQVLSFTDQQGTPGTYSYSIRVSDPHGNTVLSPTVQATYPSDDAYAKLMRSDGAAHQWRLGSAPGSSTDPDAVGTLTMTAGSGVTFGQPGAFYADANTAARFDGSGNAQAQTAVGSLPTGSSTVEAWFNTSSTTGGALVGFRATADAANPVAGDSQVYLTPSGQLSFGARLASSTVAATTNSSSYNDGKWHQLVATRTSTGLQLFVDGARMASVAAATVSPATGEWVLGGATLSGLPGASGAVYAGSIDDVSVFNGALTTRQVRNHYLAGQPGYNIIVVGG